MTDSSHNNAPFLYFFNLFAIIAESDAVTRLRIDETNSLYDWDWAPATQEWEGECEPVLACVLRAFCVCVSPCEFARRRLWRSRGTSAHGRLLVVLVSPSVCPFFRLFVRPFVRPFFRPFAFKVNEFLLILMILGLNALVLKIELS